MKHIDRKGKRSKVEALLELDLDDFRGTRKSLRGYSRIWRWHRDTVARLIDEYEATIADLGNSGGIYASGKRTGERPESGHYTGRTNVVNSTAYDTEAAGLAAGERPLLRPGSGHYLEQEQKPEREGASPLPDLPSAKGKALRVLAHESRSRGAAAAIAAALSKSLPDQRADREIRLRLIAETCFEAVGKVATEAQLRSYCRTTESLSPWLLKAAADAARSGAGNERGFPPSESAILGAAEEIEKKARAAAIAERRGELRKC